MEIISIKLKSKRNSNIFEATTEDGKFDLHSDVIVKNAISKGKINDNIFYESVEESAILIATNMTMKYLERGIKTEKQIKDYLYKKEYKKPVVDQVVGKLKEYGAINDKEYAERYVITNPKYSKNKLKQKLFSLGVRGEYIDNSVLEVDDGESCLINSRKYLKTKELDQATIDKLIRRLMSMGYTWETIRHTLKELKVEMEDEQ